MKYHIKNKQQNERVASFKYEYDRDHIFAVLQYEEGDFEKEDDVKKKCERCGGTGEIMPPIENFAFALNYIDAEPVPCPVCHPEFWKKYPRQRQNAMKGFEHL